MDLLNELQNLTKQLSNSLKQLRINGIKLSEAEREYKIAVNKKALQLRSEDMPVTVINQVIGIVEGRDFWSISENLTIDFGKYKTKERALEVLNEIQNILQPRLIVHQPNIDYDDMIHSLTEDICLRATQKVDMELKQVGQVVYQMPKE